MNTAKDAHLSLIGAEALASFDSGGEGKILANLTGSHILIRDISKELLSPLVSSFREKHRAWLIAFLTTLDGTHRKRPSLLPEGGSMAQNLYGLASRRDKSKDGPGYRFLHIRLNGIPNSAWASIGLGDAPPRERTIRALRGDLPHSLQKKLVMAMVEHTDRLESLFLNPTYLWFPELEAFFDGAENGRDFIEKVISAAERNRDKENRTNDATTNEEDVAQQGRQNFIPSMFLLWLALNHVILLPPRMSPFLSGPDNAGLAMALLTQEQALHFNTLKEHFKDYQDKSSFLSMAVPRRMELSLFTVLSSTTLRSAAEATPSLFAAIRDCSESENTNQKAIDFFKRVYVALNASLGPQRKAEHFPNRGEVRKKDRSGFSWVRMRRRENNDLLFPAGVPNDYTPNPGILWWAETFELHLKTRHGKAQQGIRTSIQSFLVWLAKTKRIGTGLHSIKREDIHDPKNPNNNTYRQHLEDAKNTNNTTKNQYLRLMHSAFETLIAEAPVPSRNPIIPDVDLFPEPRKRTTTKRNAIPRKIAALLRELNSRDDFALSKGIPEHHVLIREIGKEVSTLWFPGFATIIDLLLRIPLRGFQARFLDSGEGDERIYSTGPNEKGEMVPNPAYSRGRSEGCLVLLRSIGGKETLGLHINTNKSSLLNEEGYDIAWCPPELERSLLALREWQVEHNPLSEPIPCMERNDFLTHRNKSTTQSVKKTFPLFRSPEGNGWPISSSRLRKYWDRLVSAAEDELAAAGRPACLTEIVELDGKQVKKAIYDIHSLRVSGITALLEAGLEPDIVQQVAGHSSIMMTMYYKKTEISRINEAMERAYAKTLSDCESDGVSVDQMALGNIHPDCSTTALSMFSEGRLRMDGSVNVMTHGICPGGECSTGSIDRGPIPSGACSICRHRLTGPAFLPGIVLNANKLMHGLHVVAAEIADMDKKIQTKIDAGENPRLLEGQRELREREAESIITQWSAEIQYAEFAKRGLKAPGAQNALTCLEGEVDIRLEKRPNVVLLQNLVEGASSLDGFRPAEAILSHRLLIDDILTAGSIEPFMIGIEPASRNRAALLAGRILCSMVPEEALAKMASGQERITDHPEAAGYIKALRSAAISGCLPMENETIHLDQPLSFRVLPAKQQGEQKLPL